MRFVRYRSGWFQDSYRHSLAARGIRSSYAAIPGKEKMNFYRGETVKDEQPVQEEESTFEDPGYPKRTITKRVFLGGQGAPSAAKISGQIGIKTWSEQYGALPFTRDIARIRAGSYKEGLDLLKREDVINDTYRQQTIRDAMFQGAASRVDAGESYDSKLLKEAGIDAARLKNLDERARLAREGTLGAAGTKEFWKEKARSAGGAVKGFGTWALGAAEATVATGLKNIRDADGQPKESVYEQLQREHDRRKMEEKAAKGVFNPLRIAGIDVEELEAKDRASKRVYQQAIRADKEVDSLYRNKAKLAKVDMSAFDQGNNYFKAGNREGLIKAITALEAENGKIKDRWNIVQDTRRLVLSPENRDQSIHMESDYSMLWSSALSGGGASKLESETKKISEIEKSLRNSSNMLAARVGILRNKLKRMNAVIPPDSTVPKNINTVGDVDVYSGESGNVLGINFLGNLLDANKGALKGWNIK